MDNDPVPTTVPTRLTPKTWTTRRGIATASFALGFWGTLVFWWYPFGLAVSVIASILAVLSIVMGWRAGKDGEHLAWLGLFFAGAGISLAIAAYRFAQVAMEGIFPTGASPI